MTMSLIETKTLGTAAASIEFTSIPQDGTDLVLLFSHRSSGSGNGFQVALRFNGSTSNYSRRILFDDGSTVYSASGSSETLVRFSFSQHSGTTANTFGNAAVYIPNYTGSTAKSFSSDSVNETNATNIFSRAIYAGLWNDTAAITSITILEQDSVNFAIGTTASLYKITKGSSGGVTVS
jgi:hypothetical protein